jgi:hypothetical protein
VFGGRVELGRHRHLAVVEARGLVEITDEQTALREPARLLRRLARESAMQWTRSRNGNDASRK